MNSDIPLLYKWQSWSILYQVAPLYFTAVQLQKLLLNEFSSLQDYNYNNNNNKSLEFRGVSPALTGHCWVTRLLLVMASRVLERFREMGTSQPVLVTLTLRSQGVKAHRTSLVLPQHWHCLVWRHHHLSLFVSRILVHVRAFIFCSISDYILQNTIYYS